MSQSLSSLCPLLLLPLQLVLCYFEPELQSSCTPCVSLTLQFDVDFNKALLWDSADDIFFNGSSPGSAS